MVGIKLNDSVQGRVFFRLLFFGLEQREMVGVVLLGVVP